MEWKLLWDLKVMNILQDNEIPRGFFPLNANAAPVSFGQGYLVVGLDGSGSAFEATVFSKVRLQLAS